MTATADRATAPIANDPAAHALLREAHDATYRRMALSGHTLLAAGAAGAAEETSLEYHQR